MYYVYILYSTDFDKYYVGQSNDITKRLKQHNHGYVNSTAPYLLWKLVGFIEKNSRSEAVQLETKLKNLNKLRLKTFIDKYLS